MLGHRPLWAKLRRRVAFSRGATRQEQLAVFEATRVDSDGGR